jgi:outer membrane receptor protein involved in Fe transport
VDLTVTKAFDKGRYEIQAGVLDVFDRTKDPIRSIGSTTDHETAGRTFFGRFQMKF